MKNGQTLEYYVNIDERGEFNADVRNGEDQTVFEIDGFDIFEDGFMCDKDDIDGLSEYLVTVGIMTENDQLAMGE